MLYPLASQYTIKTIYIIRSLNLSIPVGAHGHIVLIKMSEQLQQHLNKKKILAYGIKSK